jgi:hypothetical protein
MTTYTSQHWADQIGEQIHIHHVGVDGIIREVDWDGRVWVNTLAPFSVRTLAGRLITQPAGKTLPFWPHQLTPKEAP